jgi:hypothetical protein
MALDRLNSGQIPASLTQVLGRHHRCGNFHATKVPRRGGPANAVKPNFNTIRNESF